MLRLVTLKEANKVDLSKVFYFLVVVTLLLINLPATTSFFTGGDDFREIARAKFVDSTDVSQIITTPHDGNRFRPLDRYVNLLTFQIGGFDPLFFRWRNLLIHVVCAILFGILCSDFLQNRLAGPVASLLFGLNPSNHTVIGLAVTTKSLLGLFSIGVYLLCLRAWRQRCIGLREYVVLWFLLLGSILFHEQALGNIFWPVLLFGYLAAIDKKKRWHLLIRGLFFLVTLLLTLQLGRSIAGVQNSVPKSNPLLTIGQNTALALFSLFSPVDFLLFFGRFSVSRDNIALWDDPILFDAFILIIVFLSSMLFGALIFHIRRKNKKVLLQVSVLGVGLFGALSLPVLYSKYSELYNYTATMFSVGFVLAIILPLITENTTPRLLQRAGIALLLVLSLSYGSSTSYRNTLLSNVTSETKDIYYSIRQLVPDPQPNSTFVLYNDPQLTDGYSLYGLQGANVFESFGIEPAIRLLYDRTDLDGQLLANSTLAKTMCSEHSNKSYFLRWDAETRQLQEVYCN